MSHVHLIPVLKRASSLGAGWSPSPLAQGTISRETCPTLSTPFLVTNHITLPSPTPEHPETL